MLLVPRRRRVGCSGSRDELIDCIRSESGRGRVTRAYGKFCRSARALALEMCTARLHGDSIAKCSKY